MSCRKMEIVAVSRGVPMAVRCNNCQWFGQADDLPLDIAEDRMSELFEEHHCEPVPGARTPGS